MLDDWPVVASGVAGGDRGRFTTVSSWRGPFGRVMHNGVQSGLKAHEFRKFATLPTRAGQHFEIALDVHPGDQQDVDLLRKDSWTIVNPAGVASDPFSFRRYVQAS